MSKDIEQVRRSYKPEVIRMLLVGESPPASGTFFYTGDSLTVYTQVAFQQVFPEVESLKYTEFLEYMKDNGYYLDDLCLEPVNNMDNERRELARRRSVDLLAKRIREYNPEQIIAIHKGSSDMVRLARTKAGLGHITVHETVFPSHSNQPRYIEELKAILEKIKNPTNKNTFKKNGQPEAEDFENALKQMFSTSTQAYIDVQAGELHRKIGGYPSPNHRIPLCCNVMKKMMNRGDVVMYESPSGQGATLHIRYKMPR